MNLIEELRYEISRTINTLRLRYANSADPAERKAILGSIGELNGKLSILNQAGLLQAADVLADAIQEVTAVIAFARVGPFDGLLVRGTVDLWLPTERGVLLVDHKTAARSKRFPTPEAVAEHHAVQLRLYALAAERVEGADVAGAGVLLLDPSWGDEPVFAAVDVGGDALRETREVVEAFARAELEGRYPTRWRDLLTMGA